MNTKSMLFFMEDPGVTINLAGNQRCTGDLLLSQSAIEEPLDHKDYYCKEHGN